MSYGLGFPRLEHDRKALREKFQKPLPAILPGSVAGDCERCGMPLWVGPLTAAAATEFLCPECAAQEQLAGAGIVDLGKQLDNTDLRRLILLNATLNVLLIVWSVLILIDHPKSIVTSVIQWLAIVVNAVMLFMNGMSYGRDQRHAKETAKLDALYAEADTVLEAARAQLEALKDFARATTMRYEPPEEPRKY